MRRSASRRRRARDEIAAGAFRRSGLMPLLPAPAGAEEREILEFFPGENRGAVDTFLGEKSERWESCENTPLFSSLRPISRYGSMIRIQDVSSLELCP